VIVPDITTREDARWWIRERILDLRLATWFHPWLDIIRSPANQKRYGAEDQVIRRGDILHCDVGIVYLGLCTDMQHNAYVCRQNEVEPPDGIKALMRCGNRMQQIHLEEMREGRTGNEILASVLKRGRDEGLNPTVYTHPLGIYGHGSGTMIGMPDKQAFVPGSGEHPLHVNTVYALEFSVKQIVPEWDGASVDLGFEETVLFTEKGADFADGYPRRFYLIK